MGKNHVREAGKGRKKEKERKKKNGKIMYER
jgi:hypothetical protein